MNKEELKSNKELMSRHKESWGNHEERQSSTNNGQGFLKSIASQVSQGFARNSKAPHLHSAIPATHCGGGSSSALADGTSIVNQTKS